MDRDDYAFLSQFVDNVELWNHVRDLDTSFEHSRHHLPESKSTSDSLVVAHKLHSFAWDNYYLLGIFQSKIKKISRGILNASDENNFLVLFNLARAFVEHTASLAHQNPHHPSVPLARC